VRLPIAGLRLLKERNFRTFAVGFAMSLMGAQMAGIALTFAILGSGGSVSDLSLVLTARILPLTLFLLGGGVVGDRYSRRYILAVADSLRLLGQLGLALYFLLGAHHLWVVLVLSALVGLSEALFQPALEGLVPALAAEDQLHDANALLGLARSTASVAGPALAGVLVALTGPAVAILAGAIGYGVSVLAVLLLRLPAGAGAATARRSFIGELRQGWSLFRSRSWLWTITAQFTMFNFVVWAPFLVLGPAAAREGYGGVRAWGTIMALYGLGAIVGGLLILGRRPRRPLVLTTTVTVGWAAPSAALAVHAHVLVVVVAAFVAGIASATFNALFSTAVQRSIPADSLSRIRSYIAVGAFSLGPVGLALAGPVALATSIRTVLLVGVAWQVLANAALLTLPAIRRFGSEGAPASPPSTDDVAAVPAQA
jgi:MFS family permease